MDTFSPGLKTERVLRRSYVLELRNSTGKLPEWQTTGTVQPIGTTVQKSSSDQTHQRQKHDQLMNTLRASRIPGTGMALLRPTRLALSPC